MPYRYLTTSLTGFVQQLACNVLPHGYWFYVMGVVPDSKDPEAIDRKLLAKYGVEISRQQRARRKLAGTSNLHYLRLGRVWILCATHGKHRFFDEEGSAIRDVRKAPIHIGDYTLAVKQGGFLKKDPEADEPVADGKMRVRVQIAREKFQDYRGYFIERACHLSSERLSKELYCLPFEPYAPVRRQLLTLLRLINEHRQAAGFSKLPPTVLRYKRQIVSPFEPWQTSESEADGARLTRLDC